MTLSETQKLSTGPTFPLLLLLLLLILHAEIRVTLSHKNVAGAPYRIIVNTANSPQWLMSVAKGVTE